MLDVVGAGAADVVSAKLVQHGGLLATRKVAVADAAGIGICGGCLMECSIGAAARRHVFAGLPELTSISATDPYRRRGDGAAVLRRFPRPFTRRHGGQRHARSGQIAPLRATMREAAVLYCVQMDVHMPHDADLAFFERLKVEEKTRAQELQRAGKWPHLWRVAGHYANVSIFDVADHDELHATLASLPLFRFMEVTVTPLARHSSAIT
jgi:muconolactone D-isomerase